MCILVSNIYLSCGHQLQRIAIVFDCLLEIVSSAFFWTYFFCLFQFDLRIFPHVNIYSTFSFRTQFYNFVHLLCIYMLYIYIFLYTQAEDDLQFLHQLPAGLLQDIRSERYEQPALLDADNVNELLKVYDDFYGRSDPVTGKKKVPPTKPYVQMLMLYDLLKREAKRLMLNKFEVSLMCGASTTRVLHNNVLQKLYAVDDIL